MLLLQSQKRGELFKEGLGDSYLKDNVGKKNNLKKIINNLQNDKRLLLLSPQEKRTEKREEGD